MTQKNAKNNGISLEAGHDLSGTASSNTVVGIQRSKVKTGTPSNNDLLTYNSTNTQWEFAQPTTDLSKGPLVLNTVVTNSGSAYTMQTNDQVIIIGPTGSSTINFPASSTAGRVVYIGTLQGTFTASAHAGTFVQFLAHSPTSVPASTGTIGVTAICYDGTNWIGYLI